MTEYVHPEVLVSTDWVAQHLNDPKVRIVESDEDVLLYDIGHVPQAVKIDWHMDLNDPVVRDYLNADQFSALLQAKEATYIESARAYGASNFRIITHYLLPRIMPVLIPQLVTQVPSFIFWEATLGFFNIQSNYPTWGRIIYDGLARGALYGSPFWVLEPIFLLLLTGLAFAMLGSALERILNPRILDNVPLKVEVETLPSPNPAVSV